MGVGRKSIIGNQGRVLINGESVTTTCLMSALSHFADSSRTFREVREVPIGDLSRCSNVQLLDHLVGKREQLVGNRQAERFGSLQIDDEGELGRLFDREVCWG